MPAARLAAIGAYVPARQVDNKYFESIIETTDEWIVSRTGIRTRYYAAEQEFTSDLCVAAVDDLRRSYSGDTLDDVDMIIVSTVSPDQPMPSVAALIQHRCGFSRAGAIDVYAACAGFTYGLILAQGLITAGTHRKILVFGAETLSKLTDFEDRTSCMLFGDGAGVVVIEAVADGQGNLGAGLTGAYGAGGPDLYISGLADDIEGFEVKKNRKIVQNGRRVFKWAVQTVSQEIPTVLAKNNLTLDDIDWFVPHSANMRIIEAICSEIGLPPERTLESIANFGNTSSASIPLAVYQGVRDGRVKSGDRLLLFGFGGGLAYAATVVTWP
jgi:3-oxoacyl-[acyl-carrier-protein] synthase-3